MTSSLSGSVPGADAIALPDTAIASAQSPPEIILIASTSLGEKLTRALEETSALVQTVEDLPAAQGMIGPRTIAVIFAAVDTVDHEHSIEAVDKLTQIPGLDNLPLFVVVDDEFEDDRAQALYEHGATVVFGWPSEILLMPRVIVEMLDVSVHEHVEQSADASLTEALRAHLDVDEELGANVECEVRGGCAILRGEVESLWKKQRLLHVVEHVPGIVAIVATEVMVYPPETPDPVLGDTIMAALRSAAPVDPDTLCISVMDATVTIAGTVRSREELHKVESVVANTEGVRKVENLATVSPEDARRAHKMVDTIRADLKEKFPGADIDLSILGDVVVLRGHVQTLALRRQVEQAVLSDVPEVQRVVNKLSVVGLSQ